MRTERYDIIIIGSGAGGGTMAYALADSAGAHSRPRARRFRSAGSRELEPRSGLEAPALSDEGTLARRARPGVPPVHALQRRRQHEILGQRAVPAPPRRLSAARAHGGDVARLADRLRHPRAVLRARRASLSCARRAWNRPDGTPARRRFRTRPFRTPRRWRPSSISCARKGCTRLRCRSGFVTAASSAIPATRSRARCTRRARPTCAACVRLSSGRTSTCGPTRTRRV